ncbi:MAG: hypothetical protein ACK5HO_11730 [Pseudomonadota bacterium]|jgi:hypothetical protein
MDDGDILGVLMQGRRVLPSQQRATNVDEPVALVKHWAVCGGTLAQTIASARQTLSGLKAGAVIGGNA